jgi:hypothetical protein
MDHIISNWYDGNLLQLGAMDPFVQLSFANYYALQLFHCRTFTYYTCWQPGTVPELGLPEIVAHVTAITNMCEKILQISNIPGAILLFPLRMAGAHAEIWQRGKILNLLQQVHNDGFVVAEKIKADLCEFWKYLECNISMEISG